MLSLLFDVEKNYKLAIKDNSRSQLLLSKNTRPVLTDADVGSEVAVRCVEVPAGREFNELACSGSPSELPAILQHLCHFRWMEMHK